MNTVQIKFTAKLRLNTHTHGDQKDAGELGEEGGVLASLA
jgi:hypothetical protein